MKKLGKLFEPTNIGSMRLKNRIVMSAIDSHHAARDGSVTPRLISFLSERAKGGVGLVTTGFAYIDQKASQYSYGQLGAYDDSLIVGLNLIAEAIHTYGAKASLQLGHCGRLKTIKGLHVAPSPIQWTSWTTGEELTPTGLTISEIEEIVEAYGEAARRGKQANFDAIEVHCGHGYLLSSFLSPRTNMRMDGYGGSLNNRVRFALEVAERVKEKVGKNFPLIFKISVDEYFENGITPDESKVTAQKLENQGVDAIVASGGCHEVEYELPPMWLPPGVLVHLAEEIKKVVSIPVIAVGAINDPELAEKILEEGKADLVAMGRPLIADPYLPRKAEKGEFDSVRRCIRCNATCCARSAMNLEIRCAINPAAGRELDFRLRRVINKKRIIVVGGGPAGMEAARTAALRGHEVILYERNKLGGQLLLAAIPPGKEEINHLTKFLIAQVRKLAEVKIGLKATPELIEEADPDSVIIATGSKLILPNIPGVERQNVTTFEKVLRGEAKIGKDIIVIGGGEIGAETTYFLANEGHRLTILTRMGEVAPKMNSFRKKSLMRKFVDYHVKILTNTDIEQILDDKVIVIDRARKRQTLKMDSVVIARGWESEGELFEKLKDRVHTIHRIGDCVEPRDIESAIHEASWIANRIF